MNKTYSQINNVDVEINTWFPISIYKADNLLLDKLPSYEKRIKEIITNTKISRTDMLNVDSTWGNTDISNDKSFDSLKQAICNGVLGYAEALGYDKKFLDSLVVDQIWANISKEGDYLYPHVHGQNVFSGAFYVKSYEGSKIRFHKDLADVQPIPKNGNMLNYMSCDYDCLPGRLLIFRSNLLHSTLKQTHGEKIAVSFNIKVRY
jgi:uncharacterized protein (TIGR02466 family)